MLCRVLNRLILSRLYNRIIKPNIFIANIVQWYVIMICGHLQPGREMPKIVGFYCLLILDITGISFVWNIGATWHWKAKIVIVCEYYLRMTRAKAVGLLNCNTKWPRNLLYCGFTWKCCFGKCSCSCVISGFRSCVSAVFILLACYAAYVVSNI
jgi:hypothetical protein